MDEINAIGQGVRGADIHHVVIDSRGAKRGAILWECKNARNWSDGWVTKLKADPSTRSARRAGAVAGHGRTAGAHHDRGRLH